MTVRGEKELLNRFYSDVIGRVDLEWRNDAVVVCLDSNTNLVYSIDRPAFIRGTKGDAALRYHGRWAAGVVANDIIATGAKPRGISFDIGMGPLSEEEMISFGRGVLDVCAQYGMRYEGGNIASGDEITGMAWGTAHPSNIIRRSGAQLGSVVLITAAVGTGWARRIWRYFKRNQPLPFGLEQYQNEPWVDLAAFEAVWRLRAIQCGMDITDGIVEFGYEIAEQSELGVEFGPVLNLCEIVRITASAVGLPADAMWFEPGYDTPYAHGWCVAEIHQDQVTKILTAAGVPWTIVGRTVAQKGVRAVRRDGRRVELPRYWDDALRARGSVETWLEEIVPLFR